MDSPHPDTVIVGRVSGLFGVRGWVKVYSYTDPQDNVLGYSPWLLDLGQGWRSFELEQGRIHGKGLVAKLAGIDDRDAAALLVGADVAIASDLLPTLGPGEFYWAELIGLRVFGVDGHDYGVVERLLETGANDVLVVRGDRERLIPFVRDRVVTRVDLEKGEIRVDWDPEF